MKIAFLLAFALTVLGLHAQDEVEFVVQKKKSETTTPAGLYLYRTRSFSEKGYQYGTIKLLSDTFHFYDQNLNRLSDTSKPFMKMRYFKSADTVSTYVMVKNVDTILPFFNNNVQNEVLPILPYMLWPDGQVNLQRIDMLNNKVSVSIEDKSYDCIKLLVTAPVLHSEREKVNNEHVPSKEKWYSVNYYYLRQSDYLLVKVEEAEDVRTVAEAKKPRATEILYEVYKAIE